MMTIISFKYLFLFLTVSGVVSDVNYSQESEPKLVQEYGSDVKRIHRYGDVYGVLLENTVKLQRFTSVNGTIKTEDLGRILIDKRKHGQSLSLFKLISNNTALYCSDHGCSICRESESVSCNEIGIQGKMFYYASAEVNQNKLFLTTVENNFQASIHVFQLNEDIYKIELKNKYYEDHEKQNKYGRKLIGSFSTPEYVYFLGDFVIAGHPKFNAKYSHEIVNIISRYCVDDDTPQLDSRIDLVLSCDEGNYRTVTAFDFDKIENKLVASFSKFYSLDNVTHPFICEFDFEQIQQKFDEAWQSFRTFEYRQTKNRQHCNIDADKGVCAVIRAQNSSDICAQGNVLNHFHLWGKKVFSSTRPYSFIWLRQSIYPGIFLGKTTNQILAKITMNNTDDSEQIWRTETIADAVSAFYDPYLDGNTVLYVPADIPHLLKSYQLVPQNENKTVVWSPAIELDEPCCQETSVISIWGQIIRIFEIGLLVLGVIVFAIICVCCCRRSNKDDRDATPTTTIIINPSECRAQLLPQVGNRPPAYEEKVYIQA